LIFEFLKGDSMAEKMAIGILETKSLVALIEAADASVKAAHVDLLSWRTVGSGLVSMIIEGEVAAVRSAIEAGREAASRIGEVTAELVLPKPVDEIKISFES
jgi:ethanolamine utilization protein EutM